MPIRCPRRDQKVCRSVLVDTKPQGSCDVKDQKQTLSGMYIVLIYFVCCFVKALRSLPYVTILTWIETSLCHNPTCLWIHVCFGNDSWLSAKGLQIAPSFVEIKKIYIYIHIIIHIYWVRPDASDCTRKIRFPFSNQHIKTKCMCKLWF